jgi:outer membrane cobalamin receptor
MAARTSLALLFVLGVSGCSHANHPARSSFPQGRLITSAEIERLGATDAWDVLRRSGTHISTGQTARGEPTRMARRGRSSIALSDAPLVYLDGAHLTEISLLRQLPANNIGSMRILSGIEATPLYGTNAGSGVIEIRTKIGPEGP